MIVLETLCPDCGAPFVPGEESCRLTSLHARRVCDKGRQLWAEMHAADAAGNSIRAVQREHEFEQHRRECSACNADIKR